MNKTLLLDPQKIIETLVTLEKRISERFPDSGLRRVCNEILENINESKANIEWISKPNIPIRVISFIVIAIGLAGLGYSITLIDLKIEDTTLSSIATVTEALVNDLILIGAAIFFLLTLETRLKRKRA